MSGATADGVLASEQEQVPIGASPWALARRRLLRNRIAMVMLGVLVVIVLACLAAPLYAHDVAHTNPFRSNVDGTTIVNGKSVPVMPPTTTGLGLGSTPIGPTWDPAPLPARSRRPGPRRRGAAALRRAQLAADRHLGGAHHVLHRDDRRHRRRVLRRLAGRRALAPARRRLGVPRSTCSRSASRRCC